jgi:protein-S-isoprenylcysteine O-methyltransferase Ste14
MAVIKTLAVAVLLHAIFTVSIPYAILRSTAEIGWTWFDAWLLRWLGAAAFLFGAYLYGWSLAHLLRHGTSALPGQRATRLRREGWYARCRHPLLLGVVLILLGEALFFGSFPLLAYALAYWLWLNAFLAFKEEPDLRRQFGEAYADYCRQVPRWIPRRLSRG